MTTAVCIGINIKVKDEHRLNRSRPDERTRWWVITAALLALFLGALDSLIMSAAMPTIVADLGGLHMYSWVYTAYFLCRVLAIPIFGKLADLFKVKVLFIFSIGVFLVSSIVAGLSTNMITLILVRVFQGAAAGGNFALVYVVLSDLAPPGKRGKTLSLASFTWGLASILGPTMGGAIVTYFSWRWIFFINIPVSLFSLLLIANYLVEIRPKKKQVHLDLAGVATFSTTIVTLLTLLMLGGRDFGWLSPVSISLMGIAVAAGFGFYFSEKRAKEPILALTFFKIRGFCMGNLSVFLCSSGIFCLFAYAPLFIQGALGMPPMQVGMAMLSLSLGWSLGSLFMGQVLHLFARKTAAVMGAVIFASGCGLTLGFDYRTTMTVCFWVFQMIGIGMGFVSMSTLLVVQGALDEADMGVATSSNQFARSLGGTVGVGVGGGLVMARIQTGVDNLSLSGGLDMLSPEILSLLHEDIERLFLPEFQSRMLPEAQAVLQKSVGDSVQLIFLIAFLIALLCLASCLGLPGGFRRQGWK